MIRTPLDGAIELKISGSRDVVDNIKALIESILEAEALPAEAAAPTSAHDQSETSEVPDTSMSPPGTVIDGNGAARKATQPQRKASHAPG